MQWEQPKLNKVRKGPKGPLPFRDRLICYALCLCAALAGFGLLWFGSSGEIPDHITQVLLVHGICFLPSDFFFFFFFCGKVHASCFPFSRFLFSPLSSVHFPEHGHCDHHRLGVKRPLLSAALRPRLSRPVAGRLSAQGARVRGAACLNTRRRQQTSDHHSIDIDKLTHCVSSVSRGCIGILGKRPRKLLCLVVPQSW